MAGRGRQVLHPNGRGERGGGSWSANIASKWENTTASAPPLLKGAGGMIIVIMIHTPDPSKEGRARWRVVVGNYCIQMEGESAVAGRGRQVLHPNGRTQLRQPLPF